jgi:hypothetical protein
MTNITTVTQESIEAMFQRIIEWEYEAGESFTDYYMHDNVRDVSWAFWLLGKGFVERANEILNEVNDDKVLCLDQELLYDIYPSYEGEDCSWSEENYHKNVRLWAEFLVSTDIYFQRITEWFDNYPD